MQVFFGLMKAVLIPIVLFVLVDKSNSIHAGFSLGFSVVNNISSV